MPVASKRDIKTHYGNTKLLTLRERGGKKFKAWSTKLINESIDEKIERTGTLFIKLLGLKKPLKKGNSCYDIKYKLLK